MEDVRLFYADDQHNEANLLYHVVSGAGWQVSATQLPTPLTSPPGFEFPARTCFVLLWSPTSEHWLRENLGRLRPNVSLNMGLGRAFFNVRPRFDADLSQWHAEPDHPELARMLAAISRALGREPTVNSAQGTASATHRVPGAVFRPAAEASDTKTSQADAPLDRDGVDSRRTVFLCYRRDDSQDAAGRLYDKLVSAYGADTVFMDIDSVPLGVNFVTHVGGKLENCAAVLVMIGRNWISVADEDQKRRLDSPADHVRVEIATALRRGVPLIPLLVQNAPMPRPEDLPEDIRDLAFYNGMRLAPEFWRPAVERLLKELDRVMRGDQPSPRRAE